MSLNFRQVPVFAFPNSLKFFLGTKSSHTQVLTLYSPYDFPIKYKVHCHTASWEKFVVPNAEGTIPPQSSVDLVVTHKQVSPLNCNITDKLKIVVQDPVTEQIIGKKTIDAVLLPGELDSRYHNDDDFEFQSSQGSSSRSVHGMQTNRTIHNGEKTYSSLSRHSNPQNNSYISSVIIVVCAIVLFLPTDIEIAKPSNLPTYLHVSHKIQLLAALLLGVFLCILVRS